MRWIKQVILLLDICMPTSYNNRNKSRGAVAESAVHTADPLNLIRIIPAIGTQSTVFVICIACGRQISEHHCLLAEKGGIFYVCYT